MDLFIFHFSCECGKFIENFPRHVRSFNKCKYFFAWHQNSEQVVLKFTELYWMSLIFHDKFDTNRISPGHDTREIRAVLMFLDVIRSIQISEEQVHQHAVILDSKQI